jgi:hypothetical protein
MSCDIFANPPPLKCHVLFEWPLISLWWKFQFYLRPLAKFHFRQRLSDKFDNVMAFKIFDQLYDFWLSGVWQRDQSTK